MGFGCSDGEYAHRSYRIRGHHAGCRGSFSGENATAAITCVPPARFPVVFRGWETRCVMVNRLFGVKDTWVGRLEFQILNDQASPSNSNADSRVIGTGSLP